MWFTPNISIIKVNRFNMPVSEVFNEDNMIGMARYPDKFFDLAIVDPPYGIGENWKKNRYSKFYKHDSSYKNEGIPTRHYFDELFRVSKNQIVWGANYYTDYLPARQGWIVWDKVRKFDISHMAEGELAWHSFNKPLMIFKGAWNGFIRCEKRQGDHPHEKPISLYKWTLINFSQPGNKILDTHMGSQSSRIAAYQMGFDYYGWEIDKEYFEDGNKRFKEQTAQLKLL
jgi:site-specific DNA-methyltransferase (adenine-specific)